MERFTVEFSEKDYVIEVTYWFDETGETMGEAYFKRDDMGANIVKGKFAHPYTGQEYKLHAPHKWSKSPYAVLDVLRWCSVGQMKPTKIS